MLFTCYSQLKAQHGVKPDFILQVQSNETNLDTINQRFYIHFKMYIIDTFKTDSLKLFARLPYIPDVSPEIGSYFYSTTKYFPNQTYYHGDSICDSLEIQFSKNSIPFFYQKLVLQISDVLDSVQYGSENFKVYFTPYNTIELWNSDDFDGLKRIWDTPKWGFDSLRYYVHKDSLPISNMSDSDFF